MNDVQAQKLIRAVEVADSSARLLDAVQELADARLEAAISTLIAALGYNNPGAAVAAVDGLVKIGEAAVSPLLEQIDSYNYGARAWAVRALAGIRDARGLEALLVAARTDFAMSVRRAAVKGLGTLHWHQLSPEQVQPAQAQALDTLLLASQDSEWIVRYAAVVGLQALAMTISATRLDWLSQIQAQLDRLAVTDENLAVCARTRLAQTQLQDGLLTTQPQADNQSIDTLEADWHSTLERLYNRKSEERCSPREGDPRKFRKAAAAIIPRGYDQHSSGTDDFLKQVPFR